jgi:hypothetical protein
MHYLSLNKTKIWKILFSEKKKLHNEELHDLHFSPNIFRVIRSRGKDARDMRNVEGRR